MNCMLDPWCLSALRIIEMVFGNFAAICNIIILSQSIKNPSEVWRSLLPCEYDISEIVILRRFACKCFARETACVFTDYLHYCMLELHNVICVYVVSIYHRQAQTTGFWGYLIWPCDFSAINGKCRKSLALNAHCCKILYCSFLLPTDYNSCSHK